MPFAWNDDVKIRYRTEGAGTPLVIHHGRARIIEQKKGLEAMVSLLA